MVRFESSHPLTDFQSRADEHIRRLRQTGQPELLTVDGEATLVVQDAASYRRMVELLDRAEAIAGIQRGLDSMSRGEGQSVGAAFAAIRRELGLIGE